MRSPDHVLMVHTDETLYDLGIPPINAYGRIQIEKRAEVSFGVAPASRGEGIGTGMLQALEGDAVELEVQKLVAYVHPGNTASLRAFMRQGYHIGGYPGMVQVEKPLG
jgi:phosphinothricin acetyltransferase